MKKILILGASGMAGHVVYTYLKEKYAYTILGTTNSNDFGEDSVKLNIFDVERLNEIVEEFKPNYIINCIGMLINGANMYPDKTIYANSYFPHLLAKLSVQKKFKLIHISTDCVFSGRTGGYKEESVKDATNIYGLSKSLGEIKDNKNITIRTSIIGPEIKREGEGLFDWFMKQSDKIYGYKSNLWSGVTTLELAKFIHWTIDNSLTGLCHLTNNKPISKYDLLILFSKLYNKKIYISDEKDYVCDKSFICTDDNISYKVLTYEKMLEEQKEFMHMNNNLYDHYSF